MSFDLEAWLEAARARSDAHLDACLPPASEPPVRLHEAMRYAVLGGGKRLRPALAFAAAEACGGKAEAVLPAASAVELVHAYSLVHDDLPAMDDDDVRRGRPTVHVRFDEATAVLAGDALLALAFEVLGRAYAPADTVARLAHVAGSRELVGGQSDDLRLDRAGATREAIVGIHARKTAALFSFAVWSGARAAGAEPGLLARLERFGRDYGLAFQAVDDLLDAASGETDETSLALVTDPREVRADLEARIRGLEDGLADLGPQAAALQGLAGTVAGRLT